MKKNSTKNQNESIFDFSSEDEDLDTLMNKKTYGALEESQKRRESIRLSQRSDLTNSFSVIDEYQIKSSFSETTSESDSFIRSNPKISQSHRKTSIDSEVKRKFKELKSKLNNPDSEEKKDPHSLISLKTQKRSTSEESPKSSKKNNGSDEKDSSQFSTSSYEKWVQETIATFEKIDEYKVHIE